MSELPLSYLSAYPTVLQRMLQDTRGYLLLSRTSSSTYWFSPACPSAIRNHSTLSAVMHALHIAVQTQVERVSTSNHAYPTSLVTWINLTDMFDLQADLRAQVEPVGNEYWLLWLNHRLPDLTVLRDQLNQDELTDTWLNLAQLGTWRWHLPTDRVYWDESACILLGYTTGTMATLTARSMADMVHASDQGAYHAALSRHLTEFEQDYYGEFRIRHARGHFIWVANRGKVLRWLPDGSPEWMVGAFQDITLRKLAEAQNRSSSTRLDLAMQAAGLTVIEYWLDDDKVRFDALISSLIGPQQSTLPLEMNWNEWMEHLEPTSRHVLEQAMDRARKNPGKSIQCKFGIQVAGSVRQLEWSGALYAMGLHRQRCIVGVVRDLTDQVQQDAEFEWLHAMLKETNHLARVGGWELDLRQPKLRWTSLTKEIHEVPPDYEPNLDTAIRFYMPGHSQDTIRQAIDDAIQWAKPFDLELQILTVRGTPLWVRAQGKPIVEDGEVIKVLGAFQDIDVQRKAQDIFLEQNRKLHHVTTALERSAVVSVTDAQGNIVRVNDSFCAISGYSREELIGKRHSVVQSQYHDRAFWESFWAELTAGNSWQGEICNRSKEGLIYWMYVIVHPMLDSSGRIIQYLSIQFPITDRKEAEAKLRDSEHASRTLADQYQSILSAELIYVLKLDQAGYCTFRNSTYLSAWGTYALEVGDSFLDMLSDTDRTQVVDIIQRCFDEKNFHSHLILPVVSEDVNLKFVKWEFRFMAGYMGQGQVLVVGVDVSEMMAHINQSESLLRTTSDQNYRLKSFTYITSHNIRSHAANISSIVHLLAKEREELARENLLEMLIVATHQLNQTIVDVNHILTINEVDPHEFSTCALKPIASEVIVYLQGLIDSEGARVRVDIPDDATVFAVESYLRSIVFHLVTNAIKYRDPNRQLEIEVRVELTNGAWVLSVGDNGLGIDLKRYGKKLFSMYKTFHGNEDARGFGLFLVRSQVEAMGARIEVESENGKGSIFQVYFGKAD